MTCRTRLGTDTKATEVNTGGSTFARTVLLVMPSIPLILFAGFCGLIAQMKSCDASYPARLALCLLSRFRVLTCVPSLGKPSRSMPKKAQKASRHKQRRRFVAPQKSPSCTTTPCRSAAATNFVSRSKYLGSYFVRSNLLPPFVPPGSDVRSQGQMNDPLTGESEFPSGNFPPFAEVGPLQSLQEQHYLFEFSLCLSRACLGEMIIYISKRTKSTVFLTCRALRSCLKMSPSA